MNLQILKLVELLSNSVPNNWNTDIKACANMAKAIKNKLWKDNTSVKSWFAYKQYFKKKKKPQVLICLQVTWQESQTLES